MEATRQPPSGKRWPSLCGGLASLRLDASPSPNLTCVLLSRSAPLCALAAALPCRPRRRRRRRRPPLCRASFCVHHAHCPNRRIEDLPDHVLEHVFVLAGQDY